MGPTKRQADVLDLCAGGMTRAEAAAVLRISPLAVKKRLARGRRRQTIQEDTRARYGAALGRPHKFKRIRPFSLLPTDHV